MPKTQNRQSNTRARSKQPQTITDLFLNKEARSYCGKDNGDTMGLAGFEPATQHVAHAPPNDVPSDQYAKPIGLSSPSIPWQRRVRF